MMLKLPISSEGTVPRSAADVIGKRTFLAPLSRHTWRESASSSTFNNVPAMLISPRTARLETAGLPRLIEQRAISEGNDTFRGR